MAVAYRSALDGDGTDTRPRVLVADDNADMREYVARSLAERYRVEAVADGEAALDAARACRPDLVLTDVMMPRLDGFGVLREIRADEAMCETPVIMLSARAGEESRIEGVEAGADDYLIKPFGARELVARVDAHLKMARVRARAVEALRDSEVALRRAVAEREALLKELHHRVKNNLQVIMSLLEMQAETAGHPQALSSLAEARSRVGAIASMHELLYQSESFSVIDLTSYARRLVGAPRLVLREGRTPERLCCRRRHQCRSRPRGAARSAAQRAGLEHLQACVPGQLRREGRHQAEPRRRTDSRTGKRHRRGTARDSITGHRQPSDCNSCTC
jgi:DNA-binding response OmpR family regulator